MNIKSRLNLLIKQHKKLIIILLMAAGLMFYRLDQVDLMADDSHYAVRSVGLVDTLFSPIQPTPINWFKPLPWWAYLSFHDHPTPLLFLIQHFFLNIHESIFFAKLPFTLMALGSIILVYQLTKELFYKKEEEERELFALLSAVAMAASNGVIWAGRYSHMEGGVVFFSLVALLFFVKYTKNKKMWLWFGVSLGLVLLTKYNALFIIPSIGLYLIIFHKEILRDKNFYKSWGIIFLMISPIIIYNFMLYKTRGHLDVQLSRLFGLDNPWSLSGAEGGADQIGKTLNALGKFVSYPYLAAAAVGLVLGLKHNKKFWLIAFNFIFILLFTVFIGFDPRFLILLTPFLAISLGYLLTFIFKKNLKWAKVAIIIFVVYLLFFAIRSHSFLQTTKYQGWLVSAQISENYGFSQLDKFLNTYVTDLIKDENMKTINAGRERKERKKGLEKYNDSPNKVGAYKDLNHIFLYDDELVWFPRVWIFERRLFYHNLPFFDPVSIYNIQDALDINFENVTLHLIKGVDEETFQAKEKSTGSVKIMEDNFIKNGVEPVEIKNTAGNTAFKIYRQTGSFSFVGKD